MRRLRLCFGAAAAALLTFALAGIEPATGAPLDAPACEQLNARLDTLRSEGVAADMARGPEWARANLPPDRLQRIGALIEIEEQLNFRCGLAKARIVLPTTIEGGEEEIPTPGEASGEGAPKTVVLPQKAPPVPKRPAAASAAATAAPKAPAPKAQAPKAPTSKASTNAPAVKPTAANPQEKPQKKAAPPQRASERAAKAPAEGAEPKKAPARKKAQPKSDDAYRPPARAPKASDDGAAALAPRQ